MQSIKKYAYFLVLPLALVLGGCTLDAAQSDRTEQGRVEDQQQIYVDSQPIPTFDWSLERHIFIELYKARNNAVTTYSYVRNLNGQVVFSCKSIGFPLPANMQLTNPEKIADRFSGGYVVLPQAEPNGLFSSSSNVGTYVFCINDDGTVSPAYFEAEVEAHVNPLDSSGTKETVGGELKIQVQQ